MVSAGQDPGVIDPQGRNVVTKAGFESMRKAVRRLADELADGSLTVIHEGGYQLSHLPFATLGVIEGVMGAKTDVTDPYSIWPKDWRCIAGAVSDEIAAYEDHWPTLSG